MGAASSQRMAVLVVEDDPDVCETLADAVESCGRRVYSARDGSDALNQLDAGSVPRPCLILLDWIMHPMNGENFLLRMKRRADADQFPVVVMSADSHVRPNKVPPGALGVLMKPFDIEELVRVLDEHG